jgi:hypothetical protein
VSLAAVSPALKKGALAGAPPDVIDLVNKISAVGGGLTLGEDLKVELVLTTKNAAEARDFGETVDRGLKLALAGLAVLGQGKDTNPAIDVALEVVKSLRVTVKGRNVILKGRVSADDIDDTLKRDK